MSRQNLEAIKHHYDAFNRRDLAGVLGDLDPEVEFDKTVTVAVAGPDANLYRGHEQVEGFFRSMWEATDRSSVTIDELIEAGDAVVAVVRIRGRARHTGLEGELRAVHLWDLRDGKAVRFRAFQGKAEALEALGLSE